MNEGPTSATGDADSLSVSQWLRTPAEWASILAAGTFIGIVNTIFSVAIGTLLFSGPLQLGVGLAVTASIISTLISGALIALFSQIRVNIAHVQDVGVAVLAQALAVSVAAQAMPEDSRIATALVIVTMSSLASALLLWVTGTFGWGGIVRFFPQSVLAGFLAGTGWLLTTGGLSVATGIALVDFFHAELWTQNVLVRSLPALILAAVIFVTLRLVTWKGAMIAFMFLGIGGFHLLLWLTDTPISAAQAMGWLPSANAQATGIPNLLGLAGKTDWGLVASSVPAILTVACLTVIGTLLNTSALTIVSKQDANANRELRLHGYVNLAVAAFAGPPAHTAISTSLIAIRSGVSWRGAGLVAALIALFSLFNVAALMAILPIFVTAGFILYVGFDFLYDWLIRTQRIYSRGEWAVVVIILAIVILIGFAEAIVAGLLIASLIFAWHYASVPVLRRTGSLQDRCSTLARPPAEAAMLRANGGQVEVIELQGFMFFGTADRLYEHIRQRISDRARPPLSYLIIDFQHVVGLDAAAAAQLTRIVTVAGQHPFKLVFSGYPHNVLATLSRAAPALLDGGGALSLPSLDEALETAEDAVLAQSAANLPVPTFLQRLDPFPADLPHLERLFATLPQELLGKGTVILPIGSASDSLVFLETGRVAIRAPSAKGDGRRLRAMTSGAILGDIGLALQSARTADVIAETDVTVRRLTLADMQRIEAEEPALSHALHRLQRRSLAEKFVYDERLAATTASAVPE